MYYYKHTSGCLMASEEKPYNMEGLTELTEAEYLAELEKIDAEYNALAEEKL